MKNDVCCNQLHCDPWVASSLLQKSIRRDLPDLAAQAAAKYAAIRGRDVWRRLVTIAYEDVGCGDLEVVNRLVALASDPAEIKRCGGHVAAASQVARELALAPKDRSADYLLSVLRAPFGRYRASAAGGVTGNELHWLSEVAASWAELGVGSWPKAYWSPPPLDAMARAIGDLSDPVVIEPACVAARFTRYPFVLLIPMLAARAKLAQRTIRRDRVPCAGEVLGIPLFGLDVHTRVGRRAVRELPKHSRAVRALLARNAPDRVWYDASANAVFHAESALVGSHLDWELGRELRAGGISADFMALGISRDPGLQLIAAVKDDLPTLNHLRQELFLAHELALR